MLKIAMLYLLIILTVLNARSIESELGIHIGLNSTQNEDGNKFKNPMLGVTYQDNKYVISPRIDIDYTQVKNDHASSLIKVAVNGVYEYENNTYTIPYALAGVGYEYVGGATDDVFESHPFVQAGVGVRIDLEKGFKARVEGKMLQIIGGNDEGHELMLTAGVSMPFDIRNPLVNPFGSKNIAKTRKVVRQVKRRPVRNNQAHSNNRRNGQYKIINGRKVFVVHSNNNECSIKINAPDLDRDGIPDTVDQCPATPCNFTVDNYGCPVKTTLKINFATGSAQIRPSSRFQVDQFAQFLLKNIGSRVKIIGHTDSKGSAQLNLMLSQQRANAIMHALLRQGISSSRLQAFGKGESAPLTSNASAGGRAMNRRIEAELSYPKGRR